MGTDPGLEKEELEGVANSTEPDKQSAAESTKLDTSELRCFVEPDEEDMEIWWRSFKTNSPRAM